MASDLDPAQLQELRELYTRRHKELREGQGEGVDGAGAEATPAAPGGAHSPRAARKPDASPSKSHAVAPQPTCSRVVVCTVKSVEVYDSAVCGGKNGRRTKVHTCHVNTHTHTHTHTHTLSHSLSLSPHLTCLRTRTQTCKRIRSHSTLTISAPPCHKVSVGKDDNPLLRASVVATGEVGAGVVCLTKVQLPCRAVLLIASPLRIVSCF